jgi:3',5'-cyclic AMP phosphodiesterase CpdA
MSSPLVPRRSPLAPPARVRALVAALLLAAASAAAVAQDVTLPLKPDSVRFAVIGDSGTGGRQQYEVAEVMIKARQTFPYDFVIMLGDNMYGSERPQDFVSKFERPYKALLDAGVKFYASLGNHDEPNQRFYKPFNMNGERYYTYTKGPVRFFVLDSNYMDEKQRAWFEQEVKQSTDKWKICYFHHPLYSSGARHGSEVDLRTQLEPLFIKYGVSAVFAGHEHFYERINPQKGIAYFTSGGAAKLRHGNIRKGTLTAAGFDTDRSFMLVEVAGDELFFQTFSRTGATVDAGSVPRVVREPETAPTR